MPIPVTNPGTALAITEDDNSDGELLLQQLIQIVKHGTDGATVTTPASMVPNPSNPRELIALDLDTASKQLFFRQIAIVLAKAINAIPVGGGGSFDFAENETPSGTINGTDGSDGNDLFTLANTPVSPAGVILVKTRAVMLYGVDFTVSGNQVTYLSPQKPIAGEWHRIWYRY